MMISNKSTTSRYRKERNYKEGEGREGGLSARVRERRSGILRR